MFNAAKKRQILKTQFKPENNKLIRFKSTEFFFKLTILGKQREPPGTKVSRACRSGFTLTFLLSSRSLHKSVNT